MRIPILNTIDAWYEWEPTQQDEERAGMLFGKNLADLKSLSMLDLCRLLFPDMSETATGGDQFLLLSPRPLLKGRISLSSNRASPGRIGYGPIN